MPLPFVRNTKIFVRAAAVGTVVALGFLGSPQAIKATGAQEAGLPEVARYVQQARRIAPPSDPDTQGRVFGGQPAAEGAWPWQVALLLANELSDDPASQFDSHFCGGSLISETWVLTAAHCVVGDNGPMEADAIVVLEGGTLLIEGVRRTVTKIVVHPEYDPVTISNDIAVVELAPATQRSGAQPVELTRAADEADQQVAVVTGWGMMEDGTFPFSLMETNVNIVENNACNRVFIGIHARRMQAVLSELGIVMRIPLDSLKSAYETMVTDAQGPIVDTMLCAGVEAGIKDSCSGDSGGPLLVRRDDGRFEQTGIVSFGIKPLESDKHCGNSGVYAVYTRVAEFKDWIAENTGVEFR